MNKDEIHHLLRNLTKREDGGRVLAGEVIGTMVIGTGSRRRHYDLLHSEAWRNGKSGTRSLHYQHPGREGETNGLGWMTSPPALKEGWFHLLRNKTHLQSSMDTIYPAIIQRMSLSRPKKPA